VTPLRVLHAIETPGTGGAERVLVDIARSLSSNFVSLGLGLVDGWTIQQLRANGIETHVLPLTRSFDLSWPRRFAKFLREKRIDVVHCHEFTTTCYAALGCAIASVPLIATVHGKNYWPERAYRRTALRWAMRRSQAFVAVSKDLQQFMVSTLGVREQRITVVTNGIDLSNFRPEASDEMRQLHGASPDDIVVVCVGALEPVKAHDVLLEAFANAKREVPSLKLWLVGEGYLRDSLEKRSHELELSESVRFLGWQTQVSALIRAADFTVLPSHSEGMPLAVIESLACSRAVVATRVGGTGEIVSDDVSGILIAPGSVSELQQSIVRLARDPALRDRLAREGLVQARKHFSLTSMVARYEELYRAAAHMKSA
jgi:glycosyltransferase involved in cell wall biosynthesis